MSCEFNFNVPESLEHTICRT